MLKGLLEIILFVLIVSFSHNLQQKDYSIDLQSNNCDKEYCTENDYSIEESQPLLYHELLQDSSHINIAIQRTTSFVLLFIYIATYIAHLRTNERQFLYSQPSLHISHKLAIILYPFHEFW